MSTSLPILTAFADDPDAFVEREIAADGTALTFEPMLAVNDGAFDITGTWQGEVSERRILRIPVGDLAVGNYKLYLRIPGGNDLDLGWVVIALRTPSATPPIVTPGVDYVTQAELDAALAAGAEPAPTGLTVIAGGTVDLDNTKPNGYLIGYRVTATATIETGTFLPGSYIFERDTTAPLGWTFRTLAASTPVAVADIPVTPTAPSFTNGTNTITIPAVTGVMYSKDGSTLAAGAHPGYAAGAALVVATAAPGYVLVGGTYQWGHTFGALDPTPIAPTGLTDLLLWYDASATGAITITGSGVSALRNDGSLTTSHNLVQATDGNRPGTTTVNSKTAIQFDANTDDLRKLSMSSPANTTDVTVWAVLRMDATAPTQNGTMFGTIKTNDAGQVSLPRNIRIGEFDPQEVTFTNAWSATGQVLFIAYTIPASGAAKLWVGNSSVSGTISMSALSHLIVGNSSARFTFCEGGLYDGIKTDANMAGLHSHLKTKWGTL